MLPLLTLLASPLLAAPDVEDPPAEAIGPDRWLVGARLGVVHPYGFTDFYQDLEARRGLGLGAHASYAYPLGGFTLSPGLSASYSQPQTVDGGVWSATALLLFRLGVPGGFARPYLDLGFGIGHLQAEDPPRGRARTTSFGALHVAGGLGLALGERWTLGPYLLFENVAVTLRDYAKDDAQLIASGVELAFGL